MNEKQQELYHKIYYGEHLPGNYIIDAYDFRDDLAYCHTIPLSECSSDIYRASLPDYNPNTFIILHHMISEKTPLSDVMVAIDRLIEEACADRKKSTVKDYIQTLLYGGVFVSNHDQRVIVEKVAQLMNDFHVTIDDFFYQLLSENPACYKPLLDMLSTHIHVNPMAAWKIFFPEKSDISEWKDLLSHNLISAILLPWLNSPHAADLERLDTEKKWLLFAAFSVVLSDDAYHNALHKGGEHVMLLSIFDDEINTLKNTVLDDSELFFRIADLGKTYICETDMTIFM